MLYTMSVNFKLLAGVLFSAGIIVAYFYIAYLEGKKPKGGNINEWSYKRFAQFYDKTEFNDPEFDQKIKTILRLINQEHVEDMFEIQDKSGCQTIEETIMKIMYLKNKRLIDEYYIDTHAKRITPCSVEDLALIKMYSPYLYGKPRQIDQIIVSLPKVSNMRPREAFEEVEKDIKYLIKKRLINGIRYDEVDKKIIFYTLEKKYKTREYVTKTCPNCGALVEVNIGLKARCKYCDSIIEAGDEDYSYKAKELEKEEEKSEE